MNVSSQNIGWPSVENSKRKLNLNIKNNEKSPIIEFEIPDTLKDMRFSKNYFSKGLVMIRGSPLPLND